MEAQAETSMCKSPEDRNGKVHGAGGGRRGGEIMNGLTRLEK